MPNRGLLNTVFFTAVAVSLVHYTDNYLAFERFPNGGPGPKVTADAIWIAWVVLTACGTAGYVLYRRGAVRPAAALFAVYSISGLIGLAHYTAPGMSGLAWWRHLHIWADIVCGAAVLAFAVWSVRAPSRGATAASA
ncbi:MAG TPA: hypothetical protein VD790_06115 [Thermoleophilaceae bacterium]|nr:hypothetical protein [Thermoleophilaceae bacterium]